MKKFLLLCFVAIIGLSIFNLLNIYTPKDTVTQNAATTICPKNEYVNGYTRKDGKQVGGYWRNSSHDSCVVSR